MRHLVTILTILSIGFSSLSGEASTTPDARRLQYKFKKGQALKYKRSQKMEQLIEMMGSEQQNDSESEELYEVTLEGQNEAGNLVYTMALSSYKSYVAMIDSTLENPPELIGKRIRKEISPHGDQIRSTAVDSFKLRGVLAEAFNTGAEFFPDLPREALEMGKVVKAADVDTTERPGGAIIASSDVEYTFVGEESKNGYKCLKITFKGTVHIEGKGSYQGMMEYFLEGDGDIEGVMYFAPDDGLLVSTENESELEMTAAFTGQQSMTIPITQTTHSLLTLVE